MTYSAPQNYLAFISLRMTQAYTIQTRIYDIKNTVNVELKKVTCKLPLNVTKSFYIITHPTQKYLQGLSIYKIFRCHY